MAGTNDIAGHIDVDHAPDRLGALLDQILAACIDCLVVVGSIPEIYGADTTLPPLVATYNAAIPSLVAARPRVYFVDTHAAITSQTDMADGAHPNEAGYAKLGVAWWQGLQGLP